MKIAIFVFFVLVSINSMAADNTVVLQGTAKAYANYNLIIEYTQNFITGEKTELQRFSVKKNGDFTVSFEVEDVTKINIKLGANQGFMFVKPGYEYEIVLPPFSPLQPEDQLNPFFVPEELNIGILNTDPDNLNQTIQHFDEHFNILFNKNIRNIIIGKNTKKIDQIINETDSLFPTIDSSWLFNYKLYTYQYLEALKPKSKLRTITTKYFSDGKIGYNNPAYWIAFNSTYKNFFYQYLKIDIGDSLKARINKKAGFTALVNTLSQDSIFRNKNLSELIILKAIYDAFYSKNYDNYYLLDIANQASNESVSEINKDIAEGIYNKINKLQIGTQAPDFELPTLTKRKSKTLNNFKGKFVYLNFASTNNYACKKDFQVLQTMSKVYKKDLQIVTILIDTDFDAAEQYVTKNKFDWTILQFNQNGKVLYDYNVKAYPTYYLIDPKGNILLSPAPAPEEDFSAIFSETFNNYRHKELRKNKPKQKTIYDL